MSHTNRRILLIDDMPSIHDDFRKILSAAPALSELDAMEARLFGSSHTQKDGFELDSAFQGQQGVDMAELACANGLPYALAFVDMRMPPGLDGAETIVRLWENDPLLQVVLCTAYSQYRWDELLDQLDMRDRLLILKKPFDSIEVVQLATMLTAKWSATRAAATELERLDEAVRARTLDLEREIAERRQLESRLLQSEKLAAVGRLAAGVAHEINNPLGFLTSNFQMLETYVRDLLARLDTVPAGTAGTFNDLACIRDDLPGLLTESRAGLARVAGIVQSLRDFSHVDRGQGWARADVRACLDATLAVMQAGRKTPMAIERDYGAVPEIDCMPAQLNQVFMSLIMNGVEAIGNGTGQLTIRTGTEPDKVWIEVADTGCGIAAQHLPFIFDPFFTTKGIGKGMGLGLSQVYGVVQSHQGSIAASSCEGQGTTVRLVLPVQRAEVTQEADYA
jgi:two-component system NtrC family sensor kinase